MATIKYPYAVKYGGVDYKPGAVIEVDNATEHVKRGAKEVDNAPIVQKIEARAKGRARKNQE